MYDVSFRTVTTMPGVNFTPTPEPELPGFTLYAADELYLQPGDSGRVRCGVTADLPPGTWGEFRGAAGAALAVLPGLVTAPAVGELCPAVLNVGTAVVHIAPGDPVAVLLIHTAARESVAEIAAA